MNKTRKKNDDHAQIMNYIPTFPECGKETSLFNNETNDI